jgi:omega-amidase
MLIPTIFQECFNTPYGAKYFLKHAEPLHGHTTNLLSEIAKECKIYLVGGSYNNIEHNTTVDIWTDSNK